MADAGPSESPTPGILSALASTESEETGVRTFARYLWQTKQSVRHWLTCLRQSGAPCAVICERVEDIAIVYPDAVVFAQLKTRDRGSWSAKSVCDKGHGIDALIRSYMESRKAGIHNISTFELWLEGPMSDAKATRDFFEDAAKASEEVKKKIVGLGLKSEYLADFLGRLRIVVQQPAQAHIDSVVIREMGALWPSLSTPELEDLYERLLDMATAAQAGAEPIGSIRRYIARQISSEAPGTLGPSQEDLGPLAIHILWRTTLSEMTPPLPGESHDDLLERMSVGGTKSMLELKMRRAGVSSQTLEQAQDFRAQSDIKRQLAMAGRSNGEVEFSDLSMRVLTVANAIAKRIDLNSVSNPLAAARPADAIAAEILSNPSNFGALDQDGLLGRDGFAVYGYLCQLSDECHFPWRVA